MTTVSSGQIQIVSSGQDIQDTTVLSGGEQIILAGGAANDTVISSGGVEFVSGGVAHASTVLAGGLVSGSGDFGGYDAGVVADVTIPLGLEVESGGVTSDVSISDFEVLSAGAQSIDAVLIGGFNIIHLAVRPPELWSPAALKTSTRAARRRTRLSPAAALSNFGPVVSTPA